MSKTIEQQPQVTLTYNQLIHEAFIDSIRRVTVIDDEYPTFAQLLTLQSTTAHNQQVSPIQQLKPENIERLQKIISLCHQEKNWSIDIYDGRSPKIGDKNFIPSHLGHSDLIILDYHLDGEPSTDNGNRARNIIKSLEGNNHFNIVLVHTKGSEEEDIKKVFDEILCLFPKQNQKHCYDISKEKSDIIEEWIYNNFEDPIVSFLNKKMGVQDCLKHLLFNETESLEINSTKHYLHGFEAELEALSEAINSGITKNDLIKWYINTQIQTFNDQFEGICNQKFKWEWSETDSLNFIQTGRIFITVIKKSNREPQEELINSLENALISWNAPPMHLLMAKMRHCINDKGLEQANKIMLYRGVQAGWLYNLISSKNDTDSPAHDIVINSHWEQLARKTKTEIKNFSINLVEALTNGTNNSPKSIVERFFPECLSDKNKTLAFLNAFTCSQPVLEKNLTTGTILKIDTDYWICLSPACDISPRINNQWKNRIGDNLLAFKAVKLNDDINVNTANKDANKNNYIYIIENDEPKVLSFVKQEAGNPCWDILYAANLGRFNDDKTLNINFLRIVNNSADMALAALKIETKQVTAVAELRYEYALNFLQKLGANQSRVGLGFTDSKYFMTT